MHWLIDFHPCIFVLSEKITNMTYVPSTSCTVRIVRAVSGQFLLVLRKIPAEKERDKKQPTSTFNSLAQTP
jgi:hypothetical protein